MAVAHSLGFSRIGRDRELKKAREAFCQGELDEAGLRAVGRDLRKAHWALQKDAGIELLPAGDFAWHDQVMTHSLMFGVIPEHVRPADGKATLQTLFDVARAVSERGQWFDTPCLAPEFSVDQQFQLGWEQLFEEVQEAQELGHSVKPVVIGPLTYLWLGKTQGADFDKLDLLDRLLPLYGQIFQRLADLGVEWVQIDEPILVLDLPQAWKNAFERAYNLIQRDPLKKLLATYFGGLEENLGLAANLPVDGLHFDLVHAPQQFPTILDRVPGYKVLSLGVVNGRDSAHFDLENALATVQHAHERLGDRLWLAPSCPLLHERVDPGENALALAAQTCSQVTTLAQAVNQPHAPNVQATRAVA
ncbi:5-methyltetrahydropteroyltriglutamate--homocysteine methyltransferase [Pseudomonas poae]|nr:5-methyltetrahydropteroyltriglutamate--homocysteine methyltransferase [Pseudomonas poae]